MLDGQRRQDTGGWTQLFEVTHERVTGESAIRGPLHFRSPGTTFRFVVVVAILPLLFEANTAANNGNSASELDASARDASQIAHWGLSELPDFRRASARIHCADGQRSKVPIRWYEWAQDRSEANAITAAHDTSVAMGMPSRGVSLRGLASGMYAMAASVGDDIPPAIHHSLPINTGVVQPFIMERLVADLGLADLQRDAAWSAYRRYHAAVAEPLRLGGRAAMERFERFPLEIFPLLDPSTALPSDLPPEVLDAYQRGRDEVARDPRSTWGAGAIVAHSLGGERLVKFRDAMGRLSLERLEANYQIEHEPRVRLLQEVKEILAPEQRDRWSCAMDRFQITLAAYRMPWPRDPRGEGAGRNIDDIEEPDLIEIFERVAAPGAVLEPWREALSSCGCEPALVGPAAEVCQRHKTLIEAIARTWDRELSFDYQRARTLASMIAPEERVGIAGEAAFREEDRARLFLTRRLLREFAWWLAEQVKATWSGEAEKRWRLEWMRHLRPGIGYVDGPELIRDRMRQGAHAEWWLSSGLEERVGAHVTERDDARLAVFDLVDLDPIGEAPLDHLRRRQRILAGMISIYNKEIQLVSELKEALGPDRLRSMAETIESHIWLVGGRRSNMTSQLARVEAELKQALLPGGG